MWIPQSEQDIINAIANNSLEETETFDAKREIPPKNVETAKDVSAMANSAGGVIIYGIDEDTNGRPTILTPIVLEGQREKIDQIIRTSVSEVPYLNMRTIPTSSDATLGYLIVVTPPSERAPHMVIVKGEKRFYGRGETGNYPLSEPEVARLYERRKLVDANIIQFLEDAIIAAPIDESEDFAHLFVVAKPVFQDENLLNKAVEKENQAIEKQNQIALSQASSGDDYRIVPVISKINATELLNQLIREVPNSETIVNSRYSPDFTPTYEWIRKPEGYFGKMQYASENTSRPDARTLYLQVNLDGSGRLFCGRAGDTGVDSRNQPEKWFMSSIVAGNTTKFFALHGDLFERANYYGMVDVGVSLRGLYGRVAFEANWNFFDERYVYDGNDSYRSTSRVPAMMLRENPEQIAANLLMPLIDAVSQGKSKPFISKEIKYQMS